MQFRDNARLQLEIKEMSKIELTYNKLEKDLIISGTAHLLDNIEFQLYKKTGIVYVKYTIPEIVKEAIIGLLNGNKRALYENIDLKIIKGLKSKYSIILFELAKDYEKVEIPKMEIEKFREIFGIEKKYKNFAEVRRIVINPAINEITNNLNISFIVSYKLFKKGNTYTHIKFSSKSKSLAVKKIEYTDEGKQTAIAILSLIPAKHRTAAAERMLNKFAGKGAEYLQKQIQYVNAKSRVADYLAYLKTALQNDFAGVQKSDLADEIATAEQTETKAAEQEEEKNKRKAEYAAAEKVYENLSDKEIGNLIQKVAGKSALIRKKIENKRPAELKENSIVKARVIAEMIKNGNESGSEKNKKASDDQEIRNQKRLNDALDKL